MALRRQIWHGNPKVWKGNSNKLTAPPTRWGGFRKPRFVDPMRKLNTVLHRRGKQSRARPVLLGDRGMCVCVCEGLNCLRSLPHRGGWPGSNLRPADCRSRALSTRPPSLWIYRTRNPSTTVLELPCRCRSELLAYAICGVP